MTGIVYLNHSTKCLCRLVVSLHTLRQHHPSIPVCILDTGESGGLIERIAADARLQPLDIKRIELVRNARKKNQCYLTKTSLWRHVPEKMRGQWIDSWVFLDADTAVLGDLTPLIESSDRALTLTQFANWTVATPIIHKRIAGWSDVAPEEVTASLARPSDPAINTGVFGWPTDGDYHWDIHDVLSEWELVTKASNGAFIADEIAMQVVFGANVGAHPDTFAVLGDEFNWSAIHSPRPLDQVRVAHQHGQKHVIRPDGRGDKGHEIWWPLYSAAVEQNIGGMADWTPAGDARLSDYLRSLVRNR